MILVLEATQHNKNPVIKVIMDMITEVMTKKEKGVRKLDPISNRITDTNNRRTYFLTEFASHLRKLLLQELGAESGIITFKAPDPSGHQPSDHQQRSSQRRGMDPTQQAHQHQGRERRDPAPNRLAHAVQCHFQCS